MLTCAECERYVMQHLTRQKIESTLQAYAEVRHANEGELAGVMDPLHNNFALAEELHSLLTRYLKQNLNTETSSVLIPRRT